MPLRIPPQEVSGVKKSPQTEKRRSPLDPAASPLDDWKTEASKGQGVAIRPSPLVFDPSSGKGR